MNKPITLVREDVKLQLADIINNSGLPAFIIEPIIKDILAEVTSVAKKQYEYDKAKYEESLQAEYEASENMGVDEEFGTIDNPESSI